MTLADAWAVVGGGGVGATLLLVVFLFIREDIVAGRTHRREIDRNEKLSAVFERMISLSERMTDIIEAVDHPAERNR